MSSPNTFVFSISLDEFDDIVGRIAHPRKLGTILKGVSLSFF
jgi:hypothetical protein